MRMGCGTLFDGMVSVRYSFARSMSGRQSGRCREKVAKSDFEPNNVIDSLSTIPSSFPLPAISATMKALALFLLAVGLAPHLGSIRKEQATRKNSKLGAAQRVAMLQDRDPSK